MVEILGNICHPPYIVWVKGKGIEMIGKQGQEQVREHEEAVRGLWVLLELRYYQRASFFQGFMVVE